MATGAAKSDTKEKNTVNEDIKALFALDNLRDPTMILIYFLLTTSMHSFEHRRSTRGKLC